MFYHIFRVRTNKPDIVPDYYIVNNRYVGYVGYDCASKNTIRSILENSAKVSTKLKFQLIATGGVVDGKELHTLFCEGERLELSGVDALITKYKLKRTNDETWYKEYFPIKNCSKTLLKTLDGSRIMLDDGLIVTSEEFKKNRKQYLK
jgi:hypothetical protein